MANRQWTWFFLFYNLLLLTELLHSPGSNKTFIKNISNPPVLDSPLIHMMAFHLQIQWLLPRSGKNHTFILNTTHLLCDCKPTSALILKRTYTGMKENPEITVQIHLKWRYVQLYLDYKCKTLSFEGQDGNRLQLEKIGPTFSSLNSVCCHVIENYMNNHFLCFVISACRCKAF